jgi:DNA repair protein RecN (Recombination protein N)
MLTDLSIKNVAIIDSLRVSFSPGLTVLTGETGAGKSIIIDAVNLLLGGRASSDLIRTGEEEASVEALFQVEARPEVVAALTAAGIDCDGELVVKRTVARSGRNRVFLNGSLATTALLAEVSRQLVNIYGQHEAQNLTRPEQHLLLLDSYAGLVELRNRFAALHGAYRETLAEIDRLAAGERETAQRLDLLAFQVEEIGAAKLVPGEEVELEQERNILAHGEKLLARSQAAYELLYDGEVTVLGSLRQIQSALAEGAAIDSSLAPLQEAVGSAYAQLEDTALSLRDYVSRIDADPARLQAADDRLDCLRRLKKKYGTTIAEVLAWQEAAGRELDQLRNLDRSRDELEERRAAMVQEMAALGGELSARRAEAAKAFATAVTRELGELAMANAHLEVLLEPLPEPRENGLERGEFLFSANPGEAPKPLARIASGGELSRLMLAIKQVHPESDVPTLVFDEVDTGIGGATSALVGRKLRNVAARQQVLCITHLPQVAACADHHCRVAKGVVDGRTTTTVTPLELEERVAELARMLGGVTVTDTTREHARELMAEGQR